MMASTYTTIQMMAYTHIHNHTNDGIYTHTQPYK